MYYAFINNGKLDGCGQCRQLTQGVQNIEISDEIAEHIQEYIWDGEKIIEDSNHTYQKQQRIAELKQLLADSDYWGQKYLDGEYTEEEWEAKKAQRKAWREEIRGLE